MVTAFLWIATLQLSLMLVLLPSGSVAQLPPDFLADLNTTDDELTNTLLTKCLTDVTEFATCISTTGALNLTDPANSPVLDKCVACFQNKTFVEDDGATSSLPQERRVNCTEVNQRIDKGLDECSTECAVQGCISTVEKLMQCIFRAAVNCTSGEILISPSPVASPTTTGGGGGGSNSSSGNGPVSSGVGPPTPAASGGGVAPPTPAASSGGVAPPTPAASSGATPAASSGATMSGVRFGAATLLAAATTTLAFVGLIN
jgi:hypothetical protein